MKQFIANMLAFFGFFMSRSDEQKDLSLDIVTQLKRQKALNVDLTGSVGDLGVAANDLYSQVNATNARLDSVEKRKTNVDEVFYDWGSDNSLYKPAANDADPVQAAVLFDHVMARVNKVVVPGTVINVVLSGDDAIPMMVNGVKQSGAPLETLQAVIALDGSRTYEFASSTVDEALNATGKAADTASANIKAAQPVYDAMKVDMKDLLSTPMPTAVVKIVKA